MKIKGIFPYYEITVKGTKPTKPIKTLADFDNLGKKKIVIKKGKA